MGIKIMDTKLGGVFANSQTTGFCVKWWAHGTGYGEFTFHYDPNNKWHIDNEYMDKEFIKNVLCAMVDSATLEDGEDGE